MSAAFVQAVSRGAARCALHVHGRGARTDAVDADLNGWFAPAARSAKMPAAVASWWCRRGFQQLACA